MADAPVHHRSCASVLGRETCRFPHGGANAARFARWEFRVYAVPDRLKAELPTTPPIRAACRLYTVDTAAIILAVPGGQSLLARLPVPGIVETSIETCSVVL